MYLLNGIIGTILLTLGRKLFWLFVGCTGFVFGLQVATQYLAAQPSWVAGAAAVFIGLIGALLAVFFQTLAIGLGGFAAGSTIVAYISVLTGFTVHPLITVIGGIIGAVVLYAVFDWALIFLSSLVGATLIVQSFHWNSPIESVLYVILFVIGILLQTFLWRRQKNKLE
jgi:hypothetical protein